MTIWMEVTRDRYELPVAVADSATELAEIVGVKPQSICQSRMRAEKGKLRHQRFIRVEVDDD